MRAVQAFGIMTAAIVYPMLKVVVTSVTTIHLSLRRLDKFPRCRLIVPDTIANQTLSVKTHTPPHLLLTWLGPRPTFSETLLLCKFDVAADLCLRSIPQLTLYF